MLLTSTYNNPHTTTDLGSAYGTAKSGVGISSMGRFVALRVSWWGGISRGRGGGGDESLYRSWLGGMGGRATGVLSKASSSAATTDSLSLLPYTGVMNPGLVMRNVIPVVMAGILGAFRATIDP